MFHRKQKKSFFETWQPFDGFNVWSLSGTTSALSMLHVLRDSISDKQVNINRASWKEKQSSATVLLSTFVTRSQVPDRT